MNKQWVGLCLVGLLLVGLGCGQSNYGGVTSDPPASPGGNSTQSNNEEPAAVAVRAVMAMVEAINGNIEDDSSLSTASESEGLSTVAISDRLYLSGYDTGGKYWYLVYGDSDNCTSSGVTIGNRIYYGVNLRWQFRDGNGQAQKNLQGATSLALVGQECSSPKDQTNRKKHVIYGEDLNFTAGKEFMITGLADSSGRYTNVYASGQLAYDLPEWTLKMNLDKTRLVYDGRMLWPDGKVTCLILNKQDEKGVFGGEVEAILQFNGTSTVTVDVLIPDALMVLYGLKDSTGALITDNPHSVTTTRNQDGAPLSCTEAGSYYWRVVLNLEEGVRSESEVTLPPDELDYDYDHDGSIENDPLEEAAYQLALTNWILNQVKRVDVKEDSPTGCSELPIYVAQPDIPKPGGGKF